MMNQSYDKTIDICKKRLILFPDSKDHPFISILSNIVIASLFIQCYNIIAKADINANDNLNQRIYSYTSTAYLVLYIYA